MPIWNSFASVGVWDSRHVCAIPWPSGRWRARRSIDTGHACRLHSRERVRGHVQPRRRGGGDVGRGERCRRRHRSGAGPPASRDAHGRGRHSSAQRTCTRRAGRPTRRAGGRVGPTAARRSASNRAPAVAQARSPAGHCGRVEPWKSLRAVAPRSLGLWGEAGGQAPTEPYDPCGWTVLLSLVTPFAFSVIATLPTLKRPQIPVSKPSGADHAPNYSAAPSYCAVGCPAVRFIVHDPHQVLGWCRSDPIQSLFD